MTFNPADMLRQAIDTAKRLDTFQRRMAPGSLAGATESASPAPIPPVLSTVPPVAAGAAALAGLPHSLFDGGSPIPSTTGISTWTLQENWSINGPNNAPCSIASVAGTDDAIVFNEDGNYLCWAQGAVASAGRTSHQLIHNSYHQTGWYAYGVAPPAGSGLTYALVSTFPAVMESVAGDYISMRSMHNAGSTEQLSADLYVVKIA